MEIYIASNLLIAHVDEASEHFKNHDNDMIIHEGEGSKFHYAKKVCILGTSFVSVSSSNSGWGYATKNEVDGFLISIPHHGSIEWKTNNGRHRLTAGGIAITDQRDVFLGSYSPGIQYTTIYISNLDITRYLTLLLGKPPKTRVYFMTYQASPPQISFLQNLVGTILSFVTNTLLLIQSIAESLKESLVGFVLYNFPNNYSRTLLDVNSVVLPTPHSIKIAAEFMRHNTDPHLTVGEVAAHAGMSIRALQGGFKRYKHTTPILYLRTVRLDKARFKLLNEPGISPKSVAYECGFPNYQIFCKYYNQAFFEHPNITFAKGVTRSKSDP
ncbi:helix-turn-helix transcriptional regulator [Pseudomonas syringae]|uniref:helix-turn-helix transcriptional regulator n=1 Tax=Pseudomonas syringae TaxID=317 RepID=UPI00067D71CF|nr:helix-turn-helix transcriptional regulator [Pseudomonas syringae]